MRNPNERRTQSPYMERVEKRQITIYTNKWNRLPLTAKSKLLAPDTVIPNGRYLDLFKCDVVDRTITRTSLSAGYSCGNQTVAEYCVRWARYPKDFLVMRSPEPEISEST